MGGDSSAGGAAIFIVAASMKWRRWRSNGGNSLIQTWVNFFDSWVTIVLTLNGDFIIFYFICVCLYVCGCIYLYTHICKYIN